MPYKVRKLPNQDLYKVYNADTGRVYSHHTTKRNANKQLRLLQMTGGGGVFSFLDTVNDDEARQRAIQQEIRRQEDVAREEREEQEARREARRARRARRQAREQEREQERARLEALEAYRAELRAKAEEEYQKRRADAIRYVEEKAMKKEDRRR